MADRPRKALRAVAGRWKPWSIGLGVAVLVVVGTVLWFQPRTTQDEVRRAIETELPLGSSVEQTTAFLERHGWAEHDAAPNPNRGVVDSDGFDQQDPGGSTLTHQIRDAYPGIIVRGGIEMKFGFDKNGVLTRYQLTDVYTGP